MNRTLMTCTLLLLFASLAHADSTETFGLPSPAAPATTPTSQASSAETFGIPMPEQRDKFMGELGPAILAQQGQCIDGSCAMTPTNFVNPVYSRQETFGLINPVLPAPAPAPVVVQYQQPAPVLAQQQTDRVVSQTVERTRYEEVVEQREVTVMRPVKEIRDVTVRRPVKEYVEVEVRQQVEPCLCQQPAVYPQACSQPAPAYYYQQQVQRTQTQQAISDTMQHLMGEPHFMSYESLVGKPEWQLQQMHAADHVRLDAQNRGRLFAGGNGNGPVRQAVSNFRERRQARIQGW